MAWYDDILGSGMNVFGASAPSYLKNTSPTGGLLSDAELAQLNSKSMRQGLLTTALTYLAQPKNQRYGSALPYLAKAGIAGTGAAQGVYDQATQDYINGLKMNELKKKQGLEAQIALYGKPNTDVTTTQNMPSNVPIAPDENGQSTAPNFAVTPQTTTSQTFDVNKWKKSLYPYMDATALLPMLTKENKVTYVKTNQGNVQVDENGQPTGVILPEGISADTFARLIAEGEWHNQTNAENFRYHNIIRDNKTLENDPLGITAALDKINKDNKNIANPMGQNNANGTMPRTVTAKDVVDTAKGSGKTIFEVQQEFRKRNILIRG